MRDESRAATLDLLFAQAAARPSEIPVKTTPGFQPMAGNLLIKFLNQEWKSADRFGLNFRTDTTT